MECFVLKLTLNDSPTFSNAQDFDSYLLNNYYRETDIVIENNNNDCMSFFYCKENVLYSVFFVKDNLNLFGPDVMQITDDGTCYPSTAYKVETENHANLDIHYYTGNTDEMADLFTRMAAFCECYQNNDEKTTLTDLDDWISTNSKSYTIDDVLEKSNGQYEYSEHWGFLDSSSEFSGEVGNWFTTHIDGNLGKIFTLSEFIEHHGS